MRAPRNRKTGGDSSLGALMDASLNSKIKQTTIFPKKANPYLGLKPR